jgi:hypothetical protein
MSYNASIVKIYIATSSRFDNKIISSTYFEKCSRLLQCWFCSCYFKSRRIRSGSFLVRYQSKKRAELAADEEEIDKLLDSFTKLDTVCNFDKCKTAVAVLGVNCDFCRVRLVRPHEDTF